MNIPRKTLALISSLVIVLVALFVLSLSAPKQPNSTTSQTEPEEAPVAQTTIKMIPNPLALSGANNGVIEVQMDTASNEVTAVQLEILYDPEVLKDVVIKPGTFFTSPVPLLNTIDRNEGRMSYALAITPAQAPLKGSGTIATISFTKNPSSNLTETTLKLLPRTLVAAKGVGPSVLKEATGTTIQLATNDTLP